jgi:hypothetical protein
MRVSTFPVAVIGALAALFLCPLLGGRAEGTVASDLSCGAEVTSSLTLRADLLDCPGDGLVVAANNIVINLAGHTIGGDDTTGVERLDSGILVADHSHVTVTGGTVTAFDAGV